MTKNIIAIDEKAKDKEVADIMYKNEISCAIALRKGREINIIKEYNLLQNIIYGSSFQLKVKVEEVMSFRGRCF